MVAEPHELASTIRITLPAVLRGEPKEVVGRRSGAHLLRRHFPRVDTEKGCTHAPLTSADNCNAADPARQKRLERPICRSLVSTAGTWTTIPHHQGLRRSVVVRAGDLLRPGMDGHPDVAAPVRRVGDAGDQGLDPSGADRRSRLLLGSSAAMWAMLLEPCRISSRSTTGSRSTSRANGCCSPSTPAVSSGAARTDSLHDACGRCTETA